jgi:cold shock CspA family protein
MMSRTGRIKSFDPAKGYGYIHCYESSEDVFVHAKHINGYRPGNYVTFKEGRFKGRPEAQELDDWKENTTAAEEVDMATERHMEEVQRVGVYSIWEENPEVYCDIASRRRGDEQFEQWFRRTWGADEPLNLRRNDVEVAAAHGWDWRGDQSSEANDFPSAPALRRLASDGSNDESRFSDQGHTGTIRSYNTQKGYGFIASDDSPSQDYFVHSTQINGFRVGDKVMFALREWKGEIQAHQLRKIEYLPEDGYEGQESGSSSASPDSSPQAAETYQGVIKCFLEDKKKEGKGYGFIASKMYGADVYVGEKEFKKGDFKKGDVVNFIVRVDKQGRPRASKLAASTPEVDDKIYFGTVRSFNNDSASGYGFITCTEVTEKYSRDAFLHHKQIKDFKLGDAVKFKVRLNNQGHPQAFNLEAALNSMSWLMEGLMEETKETKETKEDEAEEQAEMSHAGVIKSFDVSNGYGFITCTETSEDIFLHAKVMEGFAVGDHVCFKIRLHKGRKQAHSLEHDEAHDDTLGDGKEDDTAYIGTIKSFNTEKGYGFIQCEELHAKYGRDVFIPLSQYQGMSVGGKVTFKIQVKKNQPQAMTCAW